MEESLYVIENTKTGKWIGIDDASGGYPYDTDLIFAKKFRSIDEAVKYRNVMKEEHWQLRELNLLVNAIDWPEA